MNSHDIIVLFGLCAFESVARQATSPFCGLFTHNEFLDFEYFQVNWIGAKDSSTQELIFGIRISKSITTEGTATISVQCKVLAT